MLYQHYVRTSFKDVNGDFKGIDGSNLCKAVKRADGLVIDVSGQVIASHTISCDTQVEFLKSICRGAADGKSWTDGLPEPSDDGENVLTWSMLCEHADQGLLCTFEGDVLAEKQLAFSNARERWFKTVFNS